MPESRQVAPLDYDEPVFRGGNTTTAASHSILRPEYSDVHPQVADRLMLARPGLVLDMGCGRGVLGRLLDDRGVRWVGLDQSPTQLANGHGPRLRGDMRALPFADETFGAVATLYTLYHVEDPLLALREAKRVLRPGGLFVTCAPSRFNYPELLEYLPPEPLLSFDAEIAAEVVGEVFDDVTIQPWDMPLFRLPDAEAVRGHLAARQVEPELARETAAKVETPLWVTARGAFAWARKS